MSCKSCLACVCAWAIWSGSAPAAPEVRLASQSKALLAVVVSDGASLEVRRHAADLADYLGRISGATFSVKVGDGRDGIAVGRSGDFPMLDLAVLFDPKDPMRLDEYLIRTHKRGVLVIGSTDLAVSHAVWDLLYRMGYRQFFSGPIWEVVPRRDELSIAVDAFEHPDYVMRRIWYSGGEWSGGPSMTHPGWLDWQDRNRLTSSFMLKSGHSYKRIMNDNRQAFRAHPEYLALYKGKRQGAKFCLSNPDLRKLVVDWAVDLFEKGPAQKSLSIEPSDGADWCACEQCNKMGGVSDRVVILANEVAEAVNSRLASFGGDKYITFYAYNRHQAPPMTRLHPKIVVFVATWFLRSWTVDELLAGWSSRAVGPIGIREYLAVFSRHRCLPRRSRIGSPDYLRQTIPEFHRQGARFYLGGVQHGFGPDGLGMYLASRILWDVDEAGRVDELVEDFLAKAFGPAREPMRRFYKLLETDTKWAYKYGPDRDENLRRRATSRQEIRELYAPLAEAAELDSDERILARIHQLVLYVRYVELYQAFWSKSGPERQKAFETLARYVYRIRHSQMVCSKYFFRNANPYSKEPVVRFPAGAPGIWDSDKPPAPEEIRQMLRAGVESGQTR